MLSAQVGLCLLDPAADLPPEWGFGRGDLPPIGASPDAMLRHAGEAFAPFPYAITAGMPQNASSVVTRQQLAG